MQDPTPSPRHALPNESTTLSRHSATSQAWEDVSGSLSSAEDLSPAASGSGCSGEEMMNVPRSNNVVGRAMTDPVPNAVSASGLSRTDASSTTPAPQPTPTDRDGSRHPTPPAQPPSLTLSLFTTPSHLTLSRVIAVMGINLVLPFINGVMLGFGEIFAREVVQVGKIWWREGGPLFSSGEVGRSQEGRGRDGSFARGRGITSVGLSGSGGCP